MWVISIAVFSKQQLSGIAHHPYCIVYSAEYQVSLGHFQTARFSWLFFPVLSFAPAPPSLYSLTPCILSAVSALLCPSTQASFTLWGVSLVNFLPIYSFFRHCHIYIHVCPGLSLGHFAYFPNLYSFSANFLSLYRWVVSIVCALHFHGSLVLCTAHPGCLHFFAIGPLTTGIYICPFKTEWWMI